MRIELAQHDIDFLIKCCHAYIRDYQARGGSGYWRWRDRAEEMIEKLTKQLQDSQGKK